MIIWLMDNSISLMELLAGRRLGERMLRSPCCVIVKENNNTLLHMHKGFSSMNSKRFERGPLGLYFKGRNKIIQILFSILWIGK